MNLMKEKLEEMRMAVQQKTEEVERLKEKVAEQSKRFNSATSNFEENQRRMHEEMNKLQQTVIDVYSLKIFYTKNDVLDS